MAAQRPLAGLLRNASSCRPFGLQTTTRATSARVAATQARRTLIAAAFPPRTSRCAASFTWSTTVGRRRWLNTEKDPEPEHVEWSYEDVLKAVENPSRDVIFVDVREPEELHETGTIPLAINIPITSSVQSFHVDDATFKDMYGWDRPEKDKTLVFYCKAGIRAKSAAGLARHAGWEKTVSYPGSWLDWAKRGGPVSKIEKVE